MLKFIDLFCGIGGFRLALEKRNLECVFSSDIDAYAQEAYKCNFGEKPNGDITKISAKDIPSHDILCGGFPCQPFSISGKMGGTTDPRGKLFYEIKRIAEYHKPKVLLLENVKNILTINKGTVIKSIETELKEMGYILHKKLLNASYFGIPQSRERVYFVALKGSDLSYEFPKETRKKFYLENIFEKEVDEKFIINRSDIVVQKKDNELENKLKPIRVGLLNKGGQGERIYSLKGHAITQSAYGGGVGARTGLYNTPQGVRKLTINECKTVMGFPKKHFVSSGMQGYQQLGNAVIPSMVGYVFDGIRGL
ncbi:cytosine-specific methyltransferase [Fibrobacterales bacterium]|nr:cytosine-specific methyltransferase [Fibrobacterales bacterium]